MAFAFIASKFNPVDNPCGLCGGAGGLCGAAGGLCGGAGDSCVVVDPKNLRHVLRYDDNNLFIFFDIFISRYMRHVNPYIAF